MDQLTAILKLEVLRKYNFWDGQEVPVGFPRPKYVEKLLQDADLSRVVHVLVGQRRSGKSYVLRQVATKLFAQGVARQANP